MAYMLLKSLPTKLPNTMTTFYHLVFRSVKEDFNYGNISPCLKDTYLFILQFTFDSKPLACSNIPVVNIMVELSLFYVWVVLL